MNQRLYPCPNCGWQFPAGMVQCPRCGAPGAWRFQQAPQGFQQAPQGSWQCQAPLPLPKKGGWKKWTLIGILAFFVIGALGSGKDRQKGYETAESPAPAAEQSLQSAPAPESAAQAPAEKPRQTAEAPSPQKEEKDPCAHVKTMADWERMSYARRLAYPQCRPGRKQESGGKAAEEPIETVSASKLAADYEANEAAAEDRWQGRRIRITGIVEDIGTGLLGGVDVRLAARGSFIGVICHLDGSQRSAAAKLRKGQKVALVGRVGVSVMHVPSVHDCVLE